MAKQIDYPRASLKSSLELAVAIDDIGGKCSIEMAADKLNKKIGGSFHALVGAASKFGLVANKRGQVETTPLFKDYKLAYTPSEATHVLMKAFLMPPLFKAIFDRFENRPLPISHFEKFLIRELNVPDQISSRIAKYFLDGAKQCELLGPDDVLTGSIKPQESASEEVVDDEGAADEADNLIDESKGRERIANKNSSAITVNTYSVSIKGPGMDSVITINEEEDLLIVHAMLKKVEKKIAKEIAKEDEWGDE